MLNTSMKCHLPFKCKCHLNQNLQQNIDTFWLNVEKSIGGCVNVNWCVCEKQSFKFTTNKQPCTKFFLK